MEPTHLQPQGQVLHSQQDHHGITKQNHGISQVGKDSQESSRLIPGLGRTPPKPPLWAQHPFLPQAGQSFTWCHSAGQWG